MTARVTELTGAPPTAFSADSSVAVVAAAGFGASASPIDRAARSDDWAVTATAPGVPDAGASSGSSLQELPSADAWVHLEGNRIATAPAGFERQLALRYIKRDPSLLENDATVDKFFLADRAAETSQTTYEVQTAFNALNKLEQQDVRASKRASLLAEAQSVPEIAPGNPIPIAIYRSTQPGEYEEGKGLKLLGLEGQDFSLWSKEYPLARLGVRTLLPEAYHIPMPRADAKLFLDRYQAARAEQRQLVQVVWGEITRIGEDETISDFASAWRGSDIPTTFVPIRATLHYISANSRYQPDPVTATDTALHVWEIERRGDELAPEADGGMDALALARELALPIEDGHVVPDGRGRDRRDEAWAQFDLLAILGRNPDFAREGDRFATIAQLLLPIEQKRTFFGDRNLGSYIVRNGYLQRMQDLDYIARQAFTDEFARRDAREAFFQRYLPGIMARVPQWPLPVLRKVSVRLGEYDFKTRSFPLNYGGYAAANIILRVSALGQERGSRDPLLAPASADRFGKLPEKLFIEPEQAQALRRAAENDQIVLAWWSDLHWEHDGTEIERRFVGTSQGAGGLFPPGRGTLKRIGFFADAELTLPVLELKPEDVLLPVPEPVTGEEPADPEMPADLARLSTLPRASGTELLAAAARLLGGTTAVYDRIARSAHAVQQANEFEEPAAIAAAVGTLQAAGGPLWIDGTARLGRYDLDGGHFSFADGYRSFRVAGGDFDGRVTLELVGSDAFQSIEVRESSAKAIVEDERRN